MASTVFTETSRTAILHEEVLQDSSAPIPAQIPAPMLHVHITLRSREFSIQNPILHAEGKETLQVLQSSSRNSTHRRQGDLLEIHPCVLQDIPGNSSCSKDIPDIPVIPETFQPSRQFYNVPVFPGNPPHSSILRLECIFYIFYNSYSLIGFHRKLHRVPIGQLQTLQTFILQRKGDVAISVKLTDSPE